MFNLTAFCGKSQDGTRKELEARAAAALNDCGKDKLPSVEAKIREIQGDSNWEWEYAIFKKSEDQDNNITYRSCGR